MAQTFDLLRDCRHRLIFDPESGEAVCSRGCGIALDIAQGPRDDPSRSEPIHRIHPSSRGLGGVVSRPNARQILRNAVGPEKVDPVALRRRELRLFRAAQPEPRDLLESQLLNDVWQSLKSCCPPDYVSDDAARMVAAEIRVFKTAYPNVKGSGLRAALGRRVLAALESRYPELKGRLQLPDIQKERKPKTRDERQLLLTEE